MNIKTARHSQSAKNASESSSMLTLLELNHVETLHRGIMCAARHHILTFVDGDLDGHVLDSRTEHPFEREVVQVILSATNGKQLAFLESRSLYRSLQGLEPRDDDKVFVYIVEDRNELEEETHLKVRCVDRNPEPQRPDPPFLITFRGGDVDGLVIDSRSATEKELIVGQIYAKLEVGKGMRGAPVSIMLDDNPAANSENRPKTPATKMHSYHCVSRRVEDGLHNIEIEYRILNKHPGDE